MADRDRTRNEVLDEALAEIGSEQVDEAQVLGRGVLNVLFVLFRLVRMHSLDNDAFRKPLATLRRLLEAYGERGDGFSLRVAGDSVFVGGVFVKPDAGSYGSARYLVGAFEKLGIGGIAVSGAVTDEDVATFLERLREAQTARDEAARRGLAGARFGGIAIRAPEGEGDPLLEFKREAQHLYALLAAALEESDRLGREGRFPPLRRIKRLVQWTSDLLDRNQPLVLALAGLWGGERHRRYHPVNVGILALAIGRELGLSRTRRVNLALAGLLHDLGMDDAPGARGEPAVVPESVELLSRFEALNEHTLLWTVVADEVAMYTGHAARRPRWYHGGEGPGLFARIVVVAHHYERLTNASPERALSRHQALVRLVQRASKDLDPAVVKALVALLGVYPVGSVVELSDGGKAVVVSCPADHAAAATPIVRPLEETGGLAHRPPIDLAKAPEGLEIVGPLAPRQVSINVPGEVLA